LKQSGRNRLGPAFNWGDRGREKVSKEYGKELETIMRS
jgi:hypothetical protein